MPIGMCLTHAPSLHHMLVPTLVSFSLRMKSNHSEGWLNDLPAVDSAPVPRWKRVLDVACIFVTLPILVPMALLVAVVVKLASTGPVLFGQKRIGFAGRPFICFKFRTMAVGTDTAVHQGYLSRLIGSDLPMVKLDLQGDQRLIPFGLLLRASGLDELPQVINVLRGEMSLVGPRPCLPFEYERYVPWQRERFNTLPGLTGLWQVSGKNKTTFDEMVHLDIHYARTKSLWSDLKIMLMTFPVLIFQIQDMWSGMKLTFMPSSNGGSYRSPNDKPIVITKELPRSSSKEAAES